MLRILKWLLLATLLLLVLILSFQNLTKVQVHLLFSTIELPQAVVLASALIIGFVMGLLVSALWRVRNWRAKAAKDKQKEKSLAESGS
jgi:uncharacterized integral membrane protein